MAERNTEKREDNALSRTLAAALIALAFLCARPAAAQETLDSIAAEVNGEIILLSEVKERQFQMRAMGVDGGLDNADLARRALDTLVEEKLITQFGKEKEEYKVTENDLDNAINEMKKRATAQGGNFDDLLKSAGYTMERYRGMIRDQILARKVIENEIRAQVRIPEEAAREYYDDHKADFAGRRAARVSHILKYVSKKGTDADWQKAYEQCSEVREKIAEGLDFAEAAKQFSDDPSRDGGGDLGEVIEGEMVKEFEEVAFSLNAGVVSAPVRSPFGYHLILVKYKMPAQAAPFEKVRGEIEGKLYSEMIQTAREEWIRRVRKDAFIDIKARF